MFKTIKQCRICGNKKLEPVLSLGNQYLTGVFPKNSMRALAYGPLELVRCGSEESPGCCGLVQLRHSFNPTEMYGDDYGYRSSLNISMVKHLQEVAQNLKDLVGLRSGDMVIDIGSNDGTLLSCYPAEDLILVGIDPTASKFAAYYRSDIHIIADFFSKNAVQMKFGSHKPKIITSIAMFYDLEAPMDFIKQIHEVLADDGIWHFEQSYLPAMMEANAYDTICHEHLEYYSLGHIKWMLDRSGFKIIRSSVNEINGGSFAVTVAKHAACYPEDTHTIRSFLDREKMMGLEAGWGFEKFTRNILKHREDLLKLLHEIQSSGRRVVGYGASTKGNVILQFCGIGPDLLPCIADVNEEKFGCLTPGTHIPIVSEDDARRMQPDYWFVLPWHFRNNLIQREAEFLKRGGKMIFPLPEIEIVG
jgi:hypothetical protein